MANQVTTGGRRAQKWSAFEPGTFPDANVLRKEGVHTTPNPKRQPVTDQSERRSKEFVEALA